MVITGLASWCRKSRDDGENSALLEEVLILVLGPLMLEIHTNGRK